MLENWHDYIPSGSPDYNPDSLGGHELSQVHGAMNLLGSLNPGNLPIDDQGAFLLYFFSKRDADNKITGYAAAYRSTDCSVDASFDAEGRDLGRGKELVDLMTARIVAVKQKVDVFWYSRLFIEDYLELPLFRR